MRLNREKVNQSHDSLFSAGLMINLTFYVTVQTESHKSNYM